MSTHALNELDKDETAVGRALGFNKRKITNINFLKKHLMYHFPITALCVSLLPGHCS